MRLAIRHGTLRGVILTEHGLNFRREGTGWRCVERPGLRMMRGGRYEVDGQGFTSLARAARQVIQCVQAQSTRLVTTHRVVPPNQRPRPRRPWLSIPHGAASSLARDRRRITPASGAGRR